MKLFEVFFNKLCRLVKRMECRIILIYKCITYPCYEYINLELAHKELPNIIQLLTFNTLPSIYSVPAYFPEKETVVNNGLNIVVKRALIHNARCFAYSDLIILPNKKIINELKDVEYYRNKVDFTDEIIIRDKGAKCQINYNDLTESKKILSAIKIGGMFGFNYYHFVYQLLTRMNYIDDIDLSVPLLFDASVRDIPTFKQLVEYTNIHSREIFFMDYGCCYEIDDLYYITSPNVIVPNIKSNKFELDKMASFSLQSLEYLRTTLLPYKSSLQTPEYVFIARRRASTRRGFNEQECGEMLKKNGFVEVYPETLTLADQIAVFNNAKIIVGATGAAFTNVIFCNKNTKIVVLSNYKMRFPFFSSVSSFVGSQLIYIFDKKKGVAPSYETKYAHKSFYIDIDNLCEVMTSISENHY